MKRITRSTLLVAALATVLGSSGSWAQMPPPPPPTPPVPGTPPPPPPVPPNAMEQAQPTLPPGQWVYTAQYGWVWMPYGTNFTWISPPGEPYMFVYGGWGWGWLPAPWLLGAGPALYFGVGGHEHEHYTWYGHPEYWHGHPHQPAPPHGFRVLEPHERGEHDEHEHDEHER